MTTPRQPEYYADDWLTVYQGDCIEVMATMDPESVDAIVTDPPYGLEFMGKAWDKLGADRRQPGDPTFHKSGVGPFDRATVRYGYGGSGVGPAMQAWHARWAEAAYRVAKPSAYLLAFGGTRTVHRMTCALEDAGWIIKDMLVWGYASGFPKNKASLKPAYEPIVMARKPGPLAKLNIDACRIPSDDGFEKAWDKPVGVNARNIMVGTLSGSTERKYVDLSASKPVGGRWPANVILTATEDGRAIFDGGIEGVVGGGVASYNPAGVFGTQRADQATDTAAPFAVRKAGDGIFGYGDSGSYSRFFLVAKASRADREPTIDEYAYRLHRERGECGPSTDDAPSSSRNVCGRCGKPLPRVGSHPTVKPTELMRHLVRLVTPTDGVVLDPFAGSGSTLLAAEMEGFASIGIEQEPEYLEIIRARLNGSQRGLGLREADG